MGSACATRRARYSWWSVSTRARRLVATAKLNLVDLEREFGIKNRSRAIKCGAIIITVCHDHLALRLLLLRMRTTLVSRLMLAFAQVFVLMLLSPLHSVSTTWIAVLGATALLLVSTPGEGTFSSLLAVKPHDVWIRMRSASGANRG